MRDEPEFSRLVNGFWDIFVRVLVYGALFVVCLALIAFVGFLEFAVVATLWWFTGRLSKR